jgi:hypothetical protein
MSEILFEEVNPNGNIQALVEVEADVCFFYLHGAPETEFGVKTCWVRNLVPAPASWLGPFHTLPCDSWVNPEFEFAYLSYEHAKVPAIDLGQHLGDPVNILWLNPITELERQQAMGDSCENLANSLPAERWSMV